MRISYLGLLIVAVICVGCATVPMDKYNKDLQAESDNYQKTINGLNNELSERDKIINSLKELINEQNIKLDDFVNGPNRLLSIAKVQLEDNKLLDAKATLDVLREKSPESNEWKQYGIVLVKQIQEKLDAQNMLAAQEEEKAKKRTSTAMNKLLKEPDTFNEIDFYQDENSPKYLNEDGFYAYFGVDKAGKVYIWLRIQHVDKYPLGMSSFIIKTDSHRYSFGVNENFYKKGTADNGTWERYEYDDMMRPEINDENYKYTKIVDLLNDIITSKSVNLRIVGDSYSKDNKVTNDQIKAFSNVLDGYRYFIEKNKSP